MALWPFGKISAVSERPGDTRCSFCKLPQSVVGPTVEFAKPSFMCGHCIRAMALVRDANARKSLSVESGQPPLIEVPLVEVLPEPRPNVAVTAAYLLT